MTYGNMSRIAYALLICSFLGSGCGWFRGKGESDVLIPDEIPEDIRLADRPEDGTRISTVEFDSVYFAYDSYKINQSEIAKIEKVADYLRNNSAVYVVVEGHTDERGSREYNLSLGEHRASAVRAYLIRLGIGVSRVQTKSFGEERPVDTLHGESAWSRNRRAEFALYK